MHVFKSEFASGIKDVTEGGGATPIGDQVYLCSPWVIGKIKKTLHKNKKNFEILPLERVKFEIFAQVIC